MGGARGRLAFRIGGRTKRGLASPPLSIETRHGFASTSDCAKAANVLAMYATTVSKSSSSQKPAIHEGSGGSAQAMGTKPTRSSRRNTVRQHRAETTPHGGRKRTRRQAPGIVLGESSSRIVDA